MMVNVLELVGVESYVYVGFGDGGLEIVVWVFSYVYYFFGDIFYLKVMLENVYFFDVDIG